MPGRHLFRSPLLAAPLLLALPLAGCGEDEATPSAEPSPTATASRTAGSSTSAKPQQPVGPTLEVTVAGDDVSPMAEQMSMSAGDSLVVRVRSDRAGELHVHSSPEQYVEFGAGTTRQKLTFDKPGQVDVEEHDSGALVARILVN